jgi:hypothetical protein
VVDSKPRGSAEERISKSVGARHQKASTHCAIRDLPDHSRLHYRNHPAARKPPGDSFFCLTTPALIQGDG